jgi:hypothetical protein
MNPAMKLAAAVHLDSGSSLAPTLPLERTQAMAAARQTQKKSNLAKLADDADSAAWPTRTRRCSERDTIVAL